MSKTVTNQPFRAFDFDRDLEAVQRIWIECGWIDDDKDERAAVADFLRAGETEIATINDTAECSVCLLYTSPSPRDKRQSRMPSSA